MIKRYEFLTLEDISKIYFNFQQWSFFDRMLDVKFCRKLSITSILACGTKLFLISINGQKLEYNGISIEDKRIKLLGIIEGENKRIYAIIGNKNGKFVCCKLNQLKDFIVCERKIKIKEKPQPKIKIDTNNIISNFCKNTADKLNKTKLFKEKDYEKRKGNKESVYIV